MSSKLINVVLDLETLGTAEDAAIIQIGCAIPDFDHKHCPLTASHAFEATIRYEEALSSEFSKEHSTMEWWEKQDPEVRKQVFSGQDTYIDALDKFVAWINLVKSGGADVAIWGNGSDFDNRLLTYTLSSFGYKNVWSFRNNRDLRTLRALFPLHPDYINAIGLGYMKHTALGDAMLEADILDRTVDIFDLKV
jgi:exodeoxyribonuclease VIII